MDDPDRQHGAERRDRAEDQAQGLKLEQAPGPPPASRRRASAGPSPLRLLAAALVVAGAVGPWLRLAGVDVETFDADRAAVSIAAGLAAVIVYLAGRVPVRPGVVVCGLICTGVTGYRFLDLSVELSQIGWGLWVALAGSVALLLSALRA